MRTSSEYRASAREMLNGRWNEVALMAVIVVAATFIFTGLSVYSTVAQSVGVDLPLRLGFMADSLNTVATILLVGPLEYAMLCVLLSMKRGELNDTPSMSMFKFFSRDWSRFVVALVLEMIIIFLISIPTFGIGGIIFAYAYKMVPYLLKDYPELTAREALQMSREMMKGYKWDLFLLELTFIGWLFLTILTCGIAVIWVAPYISTAEAFFYDDLKAEVVVEE